MKISRRQTINTRSKSSKSRVLQTIKIKLLKKALKIDQEYLNAVQNSLTEWNSKRNEQAFEHLND